jgi:CXXC-20-CXXC protein
MPTCQSCGEAWNWKQTLKKMFFSGNKMSCPYCNEKQYLTTKSRKLTASFNYLSSPFIILLSLMFHITPIMTLFLLIIVPLLAVGVFPFFTDLSNKEEPLW